MRKRFNPGDIVERQVSKYDLWWRDYCREYGFNLDEVFTVLPDSHLWGISAKGVSNSFPDPDCFELVKPPDKKVEDWL